VIISDRIIDSEMGEMKEMELTSEGVMRDMF
jgi:hypothetical protein